MPDPELIRYFLSVLAGAQGAPQYGLPPSDLVVVRTARLAALMEQMEEKEKD